MKTLLILLVPLLLTGRPVGAADTRLPARDEAKYKVAPKVPIKVHPFDLKDVRLLDGPFKRAMDRDAKYLLDLEPDRMLSRLHEFAGLKPKGEVYGGWEKLGLSGHILGHYLSACSMLYAASGDERFLKRVNYLVDEVALCQKAHGNGYVGGVIEGKRIFDELAAGKIETAKFRLNGGWVPWYNLHKLYAGLVHAYRFCGNQKAKEVVVGMADWAGRVTGKLSAQQMQKMFVCEIGGMNEALADVYAITGKPEHLTLAGRFNDRSVIDPLIRREDRLEGLHANTQVPKLIGAARQYELTGEQDPRTAAVFFWDAVTRDRSYVNGGNSDSEHFRRKGEMWKRLSPQTAETCNTYNMLKLTRHLFAWTADARYADYYERALYNHILASQDPKKGMTIYFCSLKPGHFHTYGQPFDSFWCCTGSGLENHVKYGDSIYYHDDESLYVNLLIASELTWRAKGVKIRQETKFPDKPTTRLTFRCEKPVRLALKIRHPYWANADLQAAVNGQKVDAASKPGGYLSIEGRWADGDTVDVAFPMSLRVEPMDNPKKIALLYGPIVLAGQLGRVGFTEGMPYSRNHLAYMLTPTPDVPVLVTGGRPVEQWVERADSQTLQFKTNGVGRPGDVKLIPFYKAHHQRYTVYWDLQTEKQWQRTKTEREAARRRREQLRARTVDLVTPEAQSERDHKCQSEKSAAFSFHGRRCRHTEVGGWFSYEMKIAPDRPVDLRVVYWGSETGDRTFDVRIDGHNIATQTLDGQKPNEFFYRTYAIPEKLSKNKEKVTLRFESHDGHAVGRVFECRIVTRVAISSDTEARLNSLDPFYSRHVTVDGLLIASSEKVSKYARDEVAYLVRNSRFASSARDQAVESRPCGKR